MYRSLTSFSIFTLFLCFQLISQNIKISDSLNPNEPSILINHKNPKRMIVASNADWIHSTYDGGLTWSSAKAESKHGVFADPVIVADEANDMVYYFHLPTRTRGNMERVVCQKSGSFGVQWDTERDVVRQESSYESMDKEWATYDTSTKQLYVVYTKFDHSAPNHFYTEIFFTKSSDQAYSWSDPIKINKGKIIGTPNPDFTNTNRVQGAQVTSGPNGEVFVAWASYKGIVFNKSLDGGDSWLNEEIIIDTNRTWHYVIPDLVRCNGFPVIKYDASYGSQGRIYVSWSDQRMGILNTEIWLAYSDDQGETWSKAKRVNTDNTFSHQFMSTMNIEETTGKIYVLFYDRSETVTPMTNLTLCQSENYGENFTCKTVNDNPFETHKNIFMGDYQAIGVRGEIVRPVWAEFNNGKVGLWTDITESGNLIINVEENSIKNLVTHVYPNPSQNKSYVSIKLVQDSRIDLDIYDINGQHLRKVIDNETHLTGNPIFTIDKNHLNLENGLYLAVLKIDHQIKTYKIQFK